MKKLLIILLLLGVVVFVFAPQTLAYTLRGYRNDSNRLSSYMNRFSSGNRYSHHQINYREFHRNQGFNYCLENGSWR